MSKTLALYTIIEMELKNGQDKNGESSIPYYTIKREENEEYYDLSPDNCSSNEIKYPEIDIKMEPLEKESALLENSVFNERRVREVEPGSAETFQHSIFYRNYSNNYNKNRKRKRDENTSKEQIEEYLLKMESDPIFRTERTCLSAEALNYCDEQWEVLKERLNNTGTGPVLKVDEWKKRFKDWKNSTRAKYRKMEALKAQGGNIENSRLKFSTLEERGLAVWGKVAITEPKEIDMSSLLSLCEPVPESAPILSTILNCKPVEVTVTPDRIIDPPTTETTEVISEKVIEIQDFSNEKSCVIEVTENEKELPDTSRPRRRRIRSNRQPPNIVLEEIKKQNTNLVTIFSSFMEEYKKIEERKIELQERKLQLKAKELELKELELKHRFS